MKRATVVALLLIFGLAAPAMAIWPFTETFESTGFGCVSVRSKDVKYIARKAVKYRTTGRMVLTLEKYAALPDLDDLMAGRRGQPISTRELELASYDSVAVLKEKKVLERATLPDACVCKSARCVSE